MFSTQTLPGKPKLLAQHTIRMLQQENHTKTFHAIAKPHGRDQARRKGLQRPHGIVQETPLFTREVKFFPVFVQKRLRYQEITKKNRSQYNKIKYLKLLHIKASLQRGISEVRFYLSMITPKFMVKLGASFRIQGKAAGLTKGVFFFFQVQLHRAFLRASRLVGNVVHNVPHPDKRFPWFFVTLAHFTIHPQYQRRGYEQYSGTKPAPVIHTNTRMFPAFSGQPTKTIMLGPLVL